MNGVEWIHTKALHRNKTPSKYTCEIQILFSQALQMSLEERLSLVVELLPSSESEAEEDAMDDLDRKICPKFADFNFEFTK